MPHIKDKLLTETEILELDQNYVSSDSDFFIQHLQKFFKKSMETNALENDSDSNFEELYDLANDINPAALPYSELTTLIFEDDEFSESIEMFIMNLDDFINKKFSSLKEAGELRVSDQISITVLSKAKEHLNLAYAQKQSLYNKQRSELNSLTSHLDQEKITIKKLKEETDEYKEKYNKLTIDFLSMMGVFSTIIFAVFGGLSQIGAIGDNLAETPIPKILMYISLSSITLIFIVFISFNAIAKLTGLKLRSCKCEDERECKHNIFTKHPSLSLSLFFFLDLFLFAIVLRILHTDNWISSLHLFEWDSTSLSKWGPVISFMAFNCIIGGVLLWRTFNKKNS